MTKRTHPAKRRERVARQSTVSWKFYSLTLICGTIMVAGFFFAARQHFSTMDYGIKNSRLRKQMDELEAEKRRLLLNKEISLSPAELVKVAKKLGFAQYVPEVTQISAPVGSVKTQKTDTMIPVVQKTVISKPVQPSKTTAETKPAKVERQAKNKTDDGDKKYKG